MTSWNSLAGKHWVNNNYGFYANDNWHVTPRLTLNLGLRFDGLPHAFERYNKFANFVRGGLRLRWAILYRGRHAESRSLTTFQTAAAVLSQRHQEAGVNGFPRGNVAELYNTFQPRIGFAYDLSGNGKTVLRGGFGMFFERVQGNDVYNAALNPPFAYQPSATNVYFSNPNTSALTGAQRRSLSLQPDQHQVQLSASGHRQFQPWSATGVAPPWSRYCSTSAPGLGPEQ